MEYELEIEELDTLIEVFKENAKNQALFLGKVNVISQTTIDLVVDVSLKTEYDGTPVIVRFKEHVGSARRPVHEQDAQAKTELKTLEETFTQQRLAIAEKLKQAGFTIYFGTWTKE